MLSLFWVCLLAIPLICLAQECPPRISGCSCNKRGNGNNGWRITVRCDGFGGTAADFKENMQSLNNYTIDELIINNYRTSRLPEEPFTNIILRKITITNSYNLRYFWSTSSSSKSFFENIGNSLESLSLLNTPRIAQGEWSRISASIVAGSGEQPTIPTSGSTSGTDIPITSTDIGTTSSDDDSSTTINGTTITEDPSSISPNETTTDSGNSTTDNVTPVTADESSIPSDDNSTSTDVASTPGVEDNTTSTDASTPGGEGNTTSTDVSIPSENESTTSEDVTNTDNGITSTDDNNTTLTVEPTDSSNETTTSEETTTANLTTNDTSVTTTQISLLLLREIEEKEQQLYYRRSLLSVEGFPDKHQNRANTPALKELILQNNQDSSFEDLSVFASMVSIERVIMNRIGLSGSFKTDLSVFPGLQTLDLSENSLIFFKPTKIPDSLQSIDLSNNRIQIFDQGFLKTLTQPQFQSININVRSNDINCQCDYVKIIVDQLQDNFEGTCASPPQIKGRPIGEGCIQTYSFFQYHYLPNR